METLPMTILQMPKATDPSSSSEEEVEFLNPTISKIVGHDGLCY
jgi:hypothetical protein